MDFQRDALVEQSSIIAERMGPGNAATGGRKKASMFEQKASVSPAMISEDFIAGIFHEALYPR
jgi:hypothetical protein